MISTARKFLLVPCLLALATACGPSANDYDEDKVEDDTNTTDTDGESGDQILEFGLWGEIDVDPDNSYEGEEADYFWDVEAGEYTCLYTYQASGTPASTSCDQCDFAFDVELTEGATTEGDCGPYPYGYSEGQSFSYRMGFAAEFEDNYGDEHDDVFFYYYY